MTTETKQAHTPGPWKVTTRLGCSIEAPGRIVAEVFGGTTQSLRLADARLIAAAPELLAALEAIRDDESLHVDFSNDCYTPKTIHQALSAIKKARE